MIVIGSYPVRKVLGRTPTDLDLLATLDEFREYIGEGNLPVFHDKNHVYFKGDKIYDCELIWSYNTGYELAQLILNDPATYYDEDVKAWIPSINVIYMLKMSHRYLKNNSHFHKTMDDILTLRKAGAVIQPEHEEFYKKRIKETYWYEHPNLDRTKKDFFNPEDSFYIYDHDSIHEAVSVDTNPAYWEYSVDGKEVLSSKKKFFETTQQVRLRGVYEETCVLALERSQIPNNFEINPDWSFMKALEKVCTSITSGWFREFAWENYYTVATMHELATRAGVGYVNLFKMNQHKLRPFVRSDLTNIN